MPHEPPCSTTPPVILAPEEVLALLPHHATAQHETTPTPYGTVAHWQADELRWCAPAQPRALIYAAKLLGATDIIEVLPLHAINHLLDAGDVVLPDQVVDLSSGQGTTFFVDKGYGFLPHHPPYCPTLRAALSSAATQETARHAPATRPRIAARATCGALDAACMQPPLDAAACQHLRSLGVDVVGSGAVPASFLARELELCYAPLGYTLAASPLRHAARRSLPPAPPPPDAALLLAVLALLPRLLPAVRACPCPHAMQPVRERGLVGAVWQQWL
jgi:5'-methylthioadenosine phosphorylase